MTEVERPAPPEVDDPERAPHYDPPPDEEEGDDEEGLSQRDWD